MPEFWPRRGSLALALASFATSVNHRISFCVVRHQVASCVPLEAQPPINLSMPQALLIAGVTNHPWKS